MTALELRLGNYVQDKKTGQLLIVVDLAAKEVGYMPTQNVALPDGWQAEPIPITEEWLVKFGFSKEGYKPGYIAKKFETNMILDFVLTEPLKMGEFQKNYVFELMSYRYKEIAYIHQLQNLYFAITGQELQSDSVLCFTFE